MQLFMPSLLENIFFTCKNFIDISGDTFISTVAY